MKVARDGHTATILPDGTVLMAGGESQTCSTGGCSFSGSEASTELYDPAQAMFVAAGLMTQRRELQTATLLKNGDVLLAGGMGYGGIGIFFGRSATAELYHPISPVPAPLLFSVSGDGQGQGAILHANTPRVASSSDPAAAGEYLEIYLTGLADGSVIPPQVSIGGRIADVSYFGPSGYPGVNQINVRVPSGIAPGPAVPVWLTYVGRPSNQVTIGVQ
jgi:hypothetical protein